MNIWCFSCFPTIPSDCPCFVRVLSLAGTCYKFFPLGFAPIGVRISCWLILQRQSRNPIPSRSCTAAATSRRLTFHPLSFKAFIIAPVVFSPLINTLRISCCSASMSPPSHVHTPYLSGGLDRFLGSPRSPTRVRARLFGFPFAGCIEQQITRSRHEVTLGFVHDSLFRPGPSSASCRMSLTVFASFPAAHAEMARVKRRPFHHAGYLSVRCRLISYAPTPSDFPTRFAAMKHRSANVASAAKHCICFT